MDAERFDAAFQCGVSMQRFDALNRFVDAFPVHQDKRKEWRCVDVERFVEVFVAAFCFVEEFPVNQDQPRPRQTAFC